MKELIVVLLCSMLGCSVKGNPLPQMLPVESQVSDESIAAMPLPMDDQIIRQSRLNPFIQGPHIQKPSESGIVNQQSTVKPIVGSHQHSVGGQINQQLGVNPFLQGSQQHQIPSSGEHVNQPLGMKPGTQQQQIPSGGYLNQQLVVQPVDSHIQPSGGQINQQLGVKPVGNLPQQGIGGQINKKPGVNPFLQASQQHQIPKDEKNQQIKGRYITTPIKPSGDQINQQSGVKPGLAGEINKKPGVNPFLQSSQQHRIPEDEKKQQTEGRRVTSHIQPSGGQINQQSGVKPMENLHQQSVDGQINKKPGVNPFLQSSQQHEIPEDEEKQQIQGRRVPSHIRPSVGLLDQQSKARTADSHLDISDFDSETHEEHPESDSHHQIGIIMQESEVNPDGSYYNVWESENGIKVQEEGMIKIHDDVEAPSVSGSISYTDQDGKPIILTYIADENGFQPQGDHLPTPPPIPTSVVRALEYIAAHPYIEEEHTKGHKTTLMKEDLPIIDVA